jgi:hypothetical protein
LGENNTSPAFYRENIPTKYHKSNFDGSRAGHMMNMSGLHEVMSRWEGALTLICAIRHCYTDRFQINSKELLPADLFILAKICISVPAFLARRLRNPVRDGGIPADVAAMYKVTAGIFMVFRKMMEDGIHWGEADRPISAEALYEYSDRNNVLISSAGHACAGSKRKIIELMDIMIKGEADKTNSSEGLSRLKNLVLDIDVFLEYSIQAITLETLVMLCRSIVAKTFLDIDLNFLQSGAYKELCEDHAGVINRIRRMFHTNIQLDCQIEVLYWLLGKLGAASLGDELKSLIDGNGCEYMAGVKHMSHLPGGYRDEFAGAMRKYREILSFLCEKGGNSQNRIFSTLGRTKAARLSMEDAERSLNIVSWRQLEKIIGINVSDSSACPSPAKI